MQAELILLKDADEIENFYVHATGMKPNFLQLSTGLVRLQLRVETFNGLTLVWNQTNGRTRWRDEMCGEGLHLGFPVQCAGSIKLRGQEFNTDEAQVWMPGKEIEYILSGPLLSLEIGVEASLVHELGWEFHGDPHKKVSGLLLKKLVKTCQLASYMARNTQSESTKSPQTEKTNYWQNKILDAMEPLLYPWFSDFNKESLASIKACADYLHVKKVDAFFEDNSADKPCKIEQLSESIGLSRRTIHRAFRQLLGIGPRRYFELKRLYSLRNRLKHTSHYDTTVTTLAYELGFEDTGRLAALYRQHFGENPKDTLRKANCSAF